MDYAQQRHNMVESQVRPNQVTDDRILDAMAELPREAFVAKAQRGIAYVDEALPIGNGRSMMEPMIVARLLQTAAVSPGDVALHIGCGTGYAAALMSKLASTVVAVESDAKLAAEATRVLADLSIDTVAVIDGPLHEGYPKQAPYDVIFFDGAVEHIPASISDQLAENGRLVAIVAQPGPGTGKAVLVSRHGGVLSRREVFNAGTPLLPGFTRPKAFVF